MYNSTNVATWAASFALAISVSACANEGLVNTSLSNDTEGVVVLSDSGGAASSGSFGWGSGSGKSPKSSASDHGKEALGGSGNGNEGAIGVAAHAADAPAPLAPNAVGGESAFLGVPASPNAVAILPLNHAIYVEQSRQMTAQASQEKIAAAAPELTPVPAEILETKKLIPATPNALVSLAPNQIR